MSLSNSILSSKPREESGSKVSRKYSFQHTLSLFLLLKKHSELEDYVFMFDYHDDLMVLDSSLDPNGIDFYQIKSKDKGYWSVADLVRKDNANSSIIGKMYSNKLEFIENTKSLNFISNAGFKFKKLYRGALSENRTAIQAYELDPIDLDRFSKAIIEQHQDVSADGGDFKSITAFLVTDLSNKDGETHCKGELTNLIYSLNPGNSINAHLAYTQIRDEVKRKADNTTTDKSIKSLADLIELKGISKEYFLQLLQKAGLYKSVETKWSEISPQLLSSGVTALALRNYKRAYQNVEAMLIKDVNKIPLQRLVDNVKAVLLGVERDATSGKIPQEISLLGIVEHCYLIIDQSTILEYDEYFIKSLIVKCYFDE